MFIVRNFVTVLGIILLTVTPSYGQLNLLYTSFQPGQSISSAQFTANFTTISNNALNRLGGAMQGTLQVQNLTFATDNTYDVGTTSSRAKKIWTHALEGGTITATSFGCTGCIANADINASAAIADTKLAQITTASKVTEGAIADGSLLARLAANETVSGQWVFNGANYQTFNTVGGTALSINSSTSGGGAMQFVNTLRSWQIGLTGAATGSFLIYDITGATTRLEINSTGVATLTGGQLWLTGTSTVYSLLRNYSSAANTGIWAQLVTTNQWRLGAFDDIPSSGEYPLVINRSGTSIGDMVYKTNSGVHQFMFGSNLKFQIGSQEIYSNAVPRQDLFAVATTGTINNLAIASAPVVVFTGGGDKDLTGMIVNGANLNGMRIMLCNQNSGTLQLLGESATSTSTNRFSINTSRWLSTGHCNEVIYVYDRWYMVY